jgi:hypothetical protein
VFRASGQARAAGTNGTAWTAASDAPDGYLGPPDLRGSRLPYGRSARGLRVDRGGLAGHADAAGGRCRPERPRRSGGADDVGWSALLRLCAASRACDNQASVAYFQQRLAAFAVSYYQLLQQLAALPSHPKVLVNLYHDPFNTRRHCLDNVGLDPAKEKCLTSLLTAFNGVLASGAQAAGLSSVQPDFTGHALCDPGPYVQGLHDHAPFHPTPAGELAIALADEHALRHDNTPSQPPPSGSGG